MGRKLTHEEFMKLVIERNKYIRNGDIEIRGTFAGTKKPIECFCKIHSILWNPKSEDLYKGIGCKKCGAEKTAIKKLTPLHEFELLLSELDNGIKIAGPYSGVGSYAEFQCVLGHIWETRPIDILSGKGCPYCLNKKVLRGFNDLWTTHSHVAELLKNPNDGYNYTYGSNALVDFICPDCQSVFNRTIKDVCLKGFHCCVCSDGVSYPNKFARLVLKYFNIENVKYEWNPEWLKPYFYDNYFEYNGKPYVLELDGGLGHGKKKYKSSKHDVDGKKRDDYKDSLAQQHGINVIRIDCDYGDISNRLSYIKHNMINSELSDIFDLSYVDWSSCDIGAQSNLVTQVCNLYNDGLSVVEICNIIGYTIETVRKWLRFGAKHNMCNYNRTESRRRTVDKISRHVNQYKLNGEFVNTYRTVAEASEKTSIHYSGIEACCKHRNYAKTAGGYLWFYVDDTSQLNIL